MATLRDIANHIGVSEATVSRVLNGKGRAGEDTRRQILEYAQSVGYTPNQLARRLKQGESRMIGVVVPDISNEFYSVFYRLVDQRLASLGYLSVLFDISSDVNREGRVLEYLRSSMVDGMIIATAGSDVYENLPDKYLRRIVFVDNRPALKNSYSFVGSNNIDASFDLTQLFVSAGKTQIATITGPLIESSARERLEGFQRCLDQSGLDMSARWMVTTDFTYMDGIVKARSLFEEGVRPEVIIAHNNVLAYAVIRVAWDCALKVPEDVAVACFDHIDSYGFMRPIITSMVQPLENIANAACDLLMRQTVGNRSELSQIEFDSEFRLGETS